MPTYGHYQTTRELLTSGSGYASVYVAGRTIEAADAVALADPLPSSLLATKHTTATDLESVGRLLYAAVMGREFSNRVVWPIDASAEWDELGSTGQGWRSLCNTLLDPELPADF